MIGRISIRLTIAALAMTFAGVVAAQETLPYTEGSVWTLTFIKTKPGKGLEYLQWLDTVYKKEMDEAKKQGLLLSYHVISSDPGTDKDGWDLILMEEYKNLAALDGLDEKMSAISAKLEGTLTEQNKKFVERGQMRDVQGGRLSRELVLK